MEDIVSRAEFDALQSEVRQGTSYMITRLDSIDRQLSRQSSEMNEMRSEMKDMRSEMKDMRSEMKDMKEQINDVRTELKQYVHDAVDGVMAGMERLFNELRADIQRLETRIAER